MPTSGNLRLDFYESGIGDTTVITFPNGGVGLVDAHPSPSNSRPDILKLLTGRKIHFICLTHPHADHGFDLVPVLEQHRDIEEFWHTESAIPAFIYRLQDIPDWKVAVWPSEVREFSRKMAAGWASFLIDIWDAVTKRMLPVHQIRAGEEPRAYDGVEVHALAPEEEMQEQFRRFWLDKAGDPKVEKPDPNLLSAVLALRWGDSVVLLGADALRRNWRDAINRYRKLKLPKAVVIKVPHHGAANSLDLSGQSSEASYFDICLHADHRCKSVLFAGDSKHPHPKVYERLLSRTDVHCLINGIRGARGGVDLGIELEGARPVQTIEPCQPVVSFEIHKNGHVDVLAGNTCSACRFPGS